MKKAFITGITGPYYASSRNLPELRRAQHDGAYMAKLQSKQKTNS